MTSREICKKHRRGQLLKAALILLVACAGVIVYARSSRTNGHGPFSLAEDFPREALVYAQFADLPALLKQWDDSTLKQQYLNSTNFQQFQNHHLALKLISRWEEFNDALGFSLDTTAVAGAAENKAAIAVYDIGRLDLVLIAPLSDEKAAATRFFQSKEQFEGTELPDGTLYYSHEVEADRGRQKQEIAFAMRRGRFILATSEKLLLRTLANINGKSQKDRLTDDPSFKTLCGEVTPHFVTVWVDQTKLNGDWYFKHYWAMGNVEQLKGFRAGMFDLEEQDGKWIEHRDFLRAGKESKKSSAIPAGDAKRILELIPADAPYCKMQVADRDPRLPAMLIRDALLDRLPQNEKEESGITWNWESYDESDFDAGTEDSAEEGRYSYFDSDYDKTINDPDDAGTGGDDEADEGELTDAAENSFVSRLGQALRPARPIYATTLESPHTFDGPLFVEFRRAVILTLVAPGNLNRQSLERAISGLARSRLMIAGSSADFKWDNGDGQRRELELPMLGWKLCYALRGRELIVTNSAQFLDEIFADKRREQHLEVKFNSPIDDLTLIRLDQREQAFDQIVNNLDAQQVKAYWQRRRGSDESDSGKPSQEFFSGSIGSLLDVASRVSRISIRRNSSPARLREEIEFTIRKAP